MIKSSLAFQIIVRDFFRGDDALNVACRARRRWCPRPPRLLGVTVVRLSLGCGAMGLGAVGSGVCPLCVLRLVVMAGDWAVLGSEPVASPVLLDEYRDFLVSLLLSLACRHTGYRASRYCDCLG